MRLDREALDMIATARMFVDVNLLPADDDAEIGLELAEACRETNACLCADCYRRKYGTEPPAPPVVDAPDDGDLILAAIIGASQALIIALLAIIDSDDEARLAMMRDAPRVTGKTADIDETLYAAWADTKDMARHFEEQARARELEIRAKMGDAQTGLVNGMPAIARVRAVQQVPAHERRQDYLRIIKANGIAP